MAVAATSFNPQGTTNPDGSTNWGQLLTGLLSAGTGYASSQGQASAINSGQQQGLDYQKMVMQAIGSQYGPQAGAGVGAVGALSRDLGLGGGAPDFSQFYNMPGYQFAVGQGTQALQRAASAQGNLYTPQTLANVGQYVTGTAAQDYNTYIQQLMGVANLGQQANQGISSAQLQTGANVSQELQNKGAANASGVAGSAGAISSAIGSIPWGNVAKYVSTNWFGGNSSPSVGANASGVNASGASADAAFNSDNPYTSDTNP
jgi:hypothetical protein